MNVKLLIVKQGGTTFDVTELVTTITWGGSYQQATRKLTFDIITSPKDKTVPKLDIQLGDMAYLFEGTKELFRGYIWDRSMSYGDSSIKFTSYDRGIYLLRNQTVHNFKGATPEGVTAKVCTEFGIPTGSVVSTGYKFDRKFVGTNLYDIIMTSYSLASKSNGKKYMCRFTEGKLSVIEKGIVVLKIAFENGYNLAESTYTDTLDDMVNTVKVIDRDNKVVATSKNDSDIKKFGTLQKIINQDEGMKASEQAKGELKGVTKKANISGFGDPTCVTGYKVLVKDIHTGLVGSFYIDSDTHTWSKGMYDISLELNFDNIMKDSLSGSTEKEETSTSSSSGGSGKHTHPLPSNKRTSSGFGNRKHPITGKYKMHNGVDFSAPSGTPILASDGGTVIFAGTSGGYGKLVKIDHGSGVQTYYAHCSSINVKKGQKVNKGQTIAKVGTTGASTGNHLHYEVRVNGVAKNPSSYI